MKIIEAMKRIKHLQEKCADLRIKVARHCADLSYETPVYPHQVNQVSQWAQSHTDTVQEIGRLRVSIQRTNLVTSVSIELGGRPVCKVISEWIQRRKDLSQMDFELWAAMSEDVIAKRGLKEGQAKTSAGDNLPVTIRRYFDTAHRDEMAALYRSEKVIIDGQLEVVNAVTDLIEV